MSKIQLSKFVLILSCLLFSFVALAQTKAKIHIKKEINGLTDLEHQEKIAKDGDVVCVDLTGGLND